MHKYRALRQLPCGAIRFAIAPYGPICGYATFNACAMSAIRSDGCSMPIDSRIVEVENAYPLADVGGNAGVGHARGQAGQRFRAAEADGQLEDLQRVEEFEGGGLAADDVERKGRAGAGALTREQAAGREMPRRGRPR